MTTTNFLMYMFFSCLLASCDAGEKKMDEPVRIKVTEVEISLPSAEREFSFISKPFKETADYTSAKTAFETATNELYDTKLIAPFAGYVGEVYIEKYQDVKATQPVISFIDITQLKIEAYVTQDIALQAHRIKEVGIRFDACPDTIYPAKVVEISKSTTRNNLSFLMTALLPNKESKWPAGMSGKVQFGSPSSSAASMIVIPQTALNHRPVDGDYVWTVDKSIGKVSQRIEPYFLGKIVVHVLPPFKDKIIVS